LDGAHVIKMGDGEAERRKGGTGPRKSVEGSKKFEIGRYRCLADRVRARSRNKEPGNARGYGRKALERGREKI